MNYISEQNSNLELLLKLYMWLDQSLGNQQQPQLIFKEDSNHDESHSTDEFLPSNNICFVNNHVFNPIHESQPNFLVNNTNTFKPIPESPNQHYSNIPITIEPSLQDNQETKKRKHDETFPFVCCHTLETMKEEEERKKNQPKRPRGRPRKHSFEQKIQDTKRLKHE